jgi:hypothetical protein
MRAHFLADRLTSCNSAFDMQPNGVLDEMTRFFLGFPLGIATLEGRTNGHKPATLVLLNHNREFAIPHRSVASEDIVPRLPYSQIHLLTPDLPREARRLKPYSFERTEILRLAAARAPLSKIKPRSAA